MTLPILKAPRIGARAIVDDGVIFNAASGRQSASLQPLVLGHDARIRSGSVLYAGTRIGNYLETGHHVVIREENAIGHHVSIWNNTTIDYGCRIGNHVKIHCNGYIAQYSVLEDGVFLAPGVIFANDLFPGSKESGVVLQGPILEKGVQVGVNCTILPGVRIGAYSLIGAGSVVTRNIPPRSVVWGNPARLHKQTSDLRWPKEFNINRKNALAFFQHHLAGKKVRRNSLA